jgi:hypothetical protein
MYIEFGRPTKAMSNFSPFFVSIKIIFRDMFEYKFIGIYVYI